MNDRLFRRLAGALALLNLGICLAAPILFFLGRIAEGTFKTAFLISSVAWFVLAAARGAAGKGPSGS